MQSLQTFFQTLSKELLEFDTGTVVLRLILAIIAGGLIGSERGKHGSAAGLRTHILVCLGSAVTSLTGLFVSKELGYGGDVLRISAQVVSGIGFLGAGMIIVKNSNVITGLTTAAGMWATATIGIALGYGFYTVAVIAVAASLITTTFLTRVERKSKLSIHVYAEVNLPERAGAITEEIRRTIGGDILIEAAAAKSGIAGDIGLYITMSRSQNCDQLRERIEAIDGVFFVIIE